MRWVLCLALFAFSAVAFAGDTYRFPKGVVGTGDTVAELVQKGGKPDNVVQLENRFGAGMGERWEYYLEGGKLVAFVVSGGQVVAIYES